ncbi:MAG: DegT/DnrJ/EryC1/StrS family aminotransferase [Patescibacteria group bacterium]|jgi:perosamine synthetase
MKLKEYPIARPFIGKKEEGYVLEVLRSGVLSMGKKIEEFEKLFAKHIRTKYACAVSSGTAGLHLIMIATDIKSGDEVITTPFSFIASANSILYVGAKPVFVDINPNTYNIDVNKIEEKITKKTKAILVVHIFGQTADMKPIKAIAKKYKLKIIEDACESISASYDGQQAGTFGESAVFAFYPNKQLTTGEGGMIVTNKKKIYDLCVSLRNQGRAKNMQWLDHEYLGYNYRMDEMSAAVGLAQLEKINWMIAERRKIAKWYNKYLSSYTDLVQLPITAKGNKHSWFVYVIKLVPKNINRNKIINQLKLKKIYTKLYLPAIHLFDFYRKLHGYKRGDFPQTEKAADVCLALPFYIGLKEKDVKYIVDQLLIIIKKYEK